jgi:hypothetical protein
MTDFAFDYASGTVAVVYGCCRHCGCDRPVTFTHDTPCDDCQVAA